MNLRALPAPRPIPWSRIGLVLLAIYLAANLVLLAFWVPWAIHHGPWDFYVYRIASTRLLDGTLYDWGNGYVYIYSPVFAWLFAPVGALGIWVWRVLHVATLTLIPSWPLRIFLLVSWGFWMDLWEGNVTLFFMVAGYWAIRRNRWASWVFIGMAMMMPKPYYLPALAWMLWRHPENRMRFVVLFVAHGLAVLATGYAFEWPQALLGASQDMGSTFNFMPSRLIGWWWLPISLALSALLVWRNHPGWASYTAALYGGFHLPFMLAMEPDAQLRRLAVGLRLRWPLARRGDVVKDRARRVGVGVRVQE